MKVIFFSTNDSEVQQLGNSLAAAGIPCEVRKEATAEGMAVVLREAELWLQNDNDAYQAYLFCAERNVGLAKRPINGFAFDSRWEGLAA